VSQEEVQKALEKLRARRLREQGQPDEDPQQAGTFEPPTAQIEAIFDQVRSMTKRYGILPPPPFLPDIKIPASHREENTDALERLQKLEKVEEPKPKTRKCQNCTFENDESANFCQRCGEALTEEQGPEEPIRDPWFKKRRHGLEK